MKKNVIPMAKKALTKILISTIVVAFSLFFVITNFLQTPTKNYIREKMNEGGNRALQMNTLQKTALPTLKNLNGANDTGIQNLAVLQNIYKKNLADELMIFIPQGGVEDDHISDADNLAATLGEYDKYHITPRIIIEPVTDAGKMISFNSLASKEQIHGMQVFLLRLKQDGITNQQMGSWTFLPEPNIQEWEQANSTPNDFALLTTLYLTQLKQYFPQAQGSILLASPLILNTDTPESAYQSLLPYIQNIKPGLVDTFGLQGFPWVEKNYNNKHVVSLNPVYFLNASIATKAATKLGIKKIWFNSGVFAAMYINDPVHKVTLPMNTRNIIFNGIIDQAKKAKDDGYFVTLNIFAADKNNTAEAIDWSLDHDPKTYDLLFEDLQNSSVNLSFFLNNN